MISELWRLAGAAIGLGIAVGFRALFSDRLPPVQFRAYLWDSAADFLLLAAGITIAAIALLWPERSADQSGRRFTSIRWRAPTLLNGFGLALALYSFLGFGMVGEHKVSWWSPPPAAALDQPGAERLALASARQANKPTLLYFHADWCSGCADFERFVIGSPYLAAELSQFQMVRLDVTDSERWEKILRESFGDPPLPAAIVFDRQGRELEPRFVGAEQSLVAMRASLRAALQ